METLLKDLLFPFFRYSVMDTLYGKINIRHNWTRNRLNLIPRGNARTVTPQPVSCAMQLCAKRLDIVPTTLHYADF